MLTIPQEQPQQGSCLMTISVRSGQNFESFPMWKVPMEQVQERQLQAVPNGHPNFFGNKSQPSSPSTDGALYARLQKM